MTANWFEVKVKYVKVGEDGKEKKVSELYLLDSMSFTEAEGRITEKLKEIIQYDFHVTSIKPSNISEIVESKDTKDDKWFKAKVAIIDADTITGREKRSNVYFLVAGSDVNVALENLRKALSTYLVPTDVVQVGDSNIMDVFPYFEDRQE
ncbi:MAG TPA: DUF4494 domain-containing protein [Butyricimonas virosa]|uniref:DUF4494 domain-containing protein n=1 Tax=Butyricimonas virosa TaxID=544645 RepID=A0A921KYM2_9BACT|nr:DUF4494 domain-containing protein [Butyricimonas virosa]